MTVLFNDACIMSKRALDPGDSSAVVVVKRKTETEPLTIEKWFKMWTEYMETCSVHFQNTVKLNVAKNTIVSADQLRAHIIMRKDQGISVILRDNDGNFPLPVLLACTGCVTVCNARLNTEIDNMGLGANNHESASEYLDEWRLQLLIEQYTERRLKATKGSKDWEFYDSQIKLYKRTLGLMNDSSALQSFISNEKNPHVFAAVEYNKMLLQDAGPSSSLQHAKSEKREKKNVWKPVMATGGCCGLYVQLMQGGVDLHPKEINFKLEDRSLIVKCGWLPSELLSFFRQYDKVYKQEVITTLTVPATELTATEEEKDHKNTTDNMEVLVNALTFFKTLEEKLQTDFSEKTLSKKFTTETLEDKMKQHGLFDTVCTRKCKQFRVKTLVGLVQEALKPVHTTPKMRHDEFKDPDEFYEFLVAQNQIEGYKGFMKNVNSSYHWDVTHILIPPAYHVDDCHASIHSTWKTRIKDRDDEDNSARAHFLVQATTHDVIEARRMSHLSMSLQIMKFICAMNKFHQREKTDPHHFGALRSCCINVRAKKSGQFVATIIVSPKLMHAKYVKRNGKQTGEIALQTKYPFPIAMTFIVLANSGDDSSSSSEENWSSEHSSMSESEDPSSDDESGDSDEMEEKHEDVKYSDEEEELLTSTQEARKSGQSDKDPQTDCDLQSVKDRIAELTTELGDITENYVQACINGNDVDIKAYELLEGHIQEQLNKLQQDKYFLLTVEHAEEDEMVTDDESGEGGVGSGV